jgi:hypothetical protein
VTKKTAKKKSAKKAAIEPTIVNSQPAPENVSLNRLQCQVPDRHVGHCDCHPLPRG